MKRWFVAVPASVQALIDEQVFFIAGHSIDNAMAWESRLHLAIRGLSDVAGFAVDEEASDRLGFEVHRLVFERTYLIHYSLNEPDSIVNVIGFRHGAREPRRGEP